MISANQALRYLPVMLAADSRALGCQAGVICPADVLLPRLGRKVRVAKWRAYVGASGWEYRTPYAGDLAESLVAVQQNILDAGDFLWRSMAVHPFYADLVEDDGLGRPTSLAALAKAKLDRGFWDEGTHSILDVERIWVATDAHEFGAIRPLDPAEVVQVFGSEFPSVADFERVHRPGPAGPLAGLLGPKWSGRSVLIHTDGQPVEVYFWGWSGD